MKYNITLNWRSLAAVIFIGLLFSGCADKMEFNVSPVVPAATGSVRIREDNNKNFSVKLDVSDLATPERLTPPQREYVVWMVAESGEIMNIGRLESGSNAFSKQMSGQLSTVTPYKPAAIFISAEQSALISEPGSLIVLDTRKGKMGHKED
jgi:hypothetical protein